MASAACLPTALSKLIHDLDLKWIGWLCCAAPYPQAHSALTCVEDGFVVRAVRGGHRRGQMDGAATPLGERDPLGVTVDPFCRVDTTRGCS